VTASINWGDGEFSPGTVEPDGTGGYRVLGTHVFDDAGEHDVTVSLTRDGDTQTLLETTAEVEGDTSHRFLVNLYNDLLHRAADEAGLTSWKASLDGGATRAEVVRGFEGSREFRSNVINDAYLEYLGRTAEPFGLTTWLNFLDGGGTHEELRARIASSGEFFSRQGGGTNAGFLAALYREVLHRDIDAFGAAAWGQALTRGMTRNEVALAIMQSFEAQNVTVRDWYRDYLGRDADEFGLQVFVGALQGGARSHHLVVEVLSSDEYFARA
jgi:hypothetical protein